VRQELKIAYLVLTYAANTLKNGARHQNIVILMFLNIPFQQFIHMRSYTRSIYYPYKIYSNAHIILKHRLLKSIQFTS
jgi:hypothetical protein